MRDRTVKFTKWPDYMIVIAVLVLAIGCIEKKDECSQEGDSWCDGDIHMRCLNDGPTTWESDPPNYVTEENCTDYSATCIEETFAGEIVSYCGYLEGSCPNSTSTVCIDSTFIGFCRYGKSYPNASDSSLDCVDKNWECVESVSESNYVEAVCTYVTEHCETEDQIICHDGEFGNNRLWCEDGVWVPYVCDDSEPCCILESNGVGTCVDIEDQADMCI